MNPALCFEIKKIYPVLQSVLARGLRGGLRLGLALTHVLRPVTRTFTLFVHFYGAGTPTVPIPMCAREPT